MFSEIKQDILPTEFGYMAMKNFAKSQSDSVTICHTLNTLSLNL